MSRVKSLIHRFYKDEQGAALIEYTVLLGVLVVAVIASITFVGGWVRDQWVALSGSLPVPPAP